MLAACLGCLFLYALSTSFAASAVMGYWTIIKWSLVWVLQLFTIRYLGQLTVSPNFIPMLHRRQRPDRTRWTRIHQTLRTVSPSLGRHWYPLLRFCCSRLICHLLPCSIWRFTSSYRWYITLGRYLHDACRENTQSRQAPNPGVLLCLGFTWVAFHHNYMSDKIEWELHKSFTSYSYMLLLY